MIDNGFYQNALQQTQQSYTDLQSLQKIRVDGKKDQSAALKQVAQQFESLFLQMMLKSMRSANDVFAKDNPLNSFESKFYQDMYDNQLSLSLSQKGIGIAEALYQQLSSHIQPQVNGVTKPYIGSLPGNNNGQPVIPVVTKVNQSQSIAELKTPEDFIQLVKPYAQKIAKEMGVDYRAIIAQSALETGWGKNLIKDSYGRQTFNFFNIKEGSNWDGKSVSVSTLEYTNGIAKKENARFRRYDSIQESFDDYKNLVFSPRYQQALTSKDDGEQFISSLHKSGYATDPHYVEKITTIMKERFSL